MAAGSSEDVASNFIFISDDGDALTFFIRPSETKARLRPLIEKAGGLVTSRSGGGDDIIRISAENDIATSEGCVKAQFVDDCLAQNKLLDTNDYLCISNIKAAVPVEASNVLVNVTTTGRKKYTEDADRAILQYVAKHPTKYGGNTMWKKMELMKITSHSWQSMKDHFLKYLEGRLPEYIDLEKECQQEILRRKRTEEESAQPKRLRSHQEAVTEDRQGMIYEFLKEMEDPPVEEFDPEDTNVIDDIEKQLMDQIQYWCQTFGLSKKAIAIALHINSGDLNKTEHLLEKKMLSHGTRMWSHDDDHLLLNGRSFSKLCSKYGRESVKVRKVFLTDWRETTT